MIIKFLENLKKEAKKTNKQTTKWKLLVILAQNPE